ncbi:MAG: sporulation protein YabP, partial [Clostridiales bacterium]|nr:sporulation protein YabP [Clostridiales bacterium]
MAVSEEKRSAARHAITIDHRENATITGVLDVISFDEETIVADTELGVLILHGASLHVNRLNLESGDLEIDGDIAGINYEDQGSYAKG